MKCVNNTHPEGEPLPDWEIYLMDSFGRAGEPVGGVLGLVFTPEQALAAFVEMAPELSRYPLIAVRSAIAPPWSMYEGA